MFRRDSLGVYRRGIAGSIPRLDSSIARRGRKKIRGRKKKSAKIAPLDFEILYFKQKSLYYRVLFSKILRLRLK